MAARESVILKSCACGRTYSFSSWQRLALCGYVEKGLPSAGELLELRRCVCGSSIAIDLGQEPDSIAAIKLAR